MNLWGDKFRTVKLPRRPCELLEEQAKHISEMTEGVLEGKIRKEPSTDASKTEWVLSVALKDREYEICRISYCDALYPVQISSSSIGWSRSVLDEQSLLKDLSTCLSDDKIHRAIASLLQQAKASD